MRAEEKYGKNCIKKLFIDPDLRAILRWPKLLVMLWILNRNKSEYTEYIKTDKRTFAVSRFGGDLHGDFVDGSDFGQNISRVQEIYANNGQILNWLGSNLFGANYFAYLVSKSLWEWDVNTIKILM